MKRIVSFTLALVITLFLCACGQQSAEADTALLQPKTGIAYFFERIGNLFD